jgi:hypothetical protein
MIRETRSSFVQKSEPESDFCYDNAENLKHEQNLREKDIC